MSKNNIGVLDPPQKKSPGRFEASAERQVFNEELNIIHHTKTNNCTQDQVLYCPLAYQASVEKRVCTLLGLPRYSISSYMNAHSLGVRESVRQLDIGVTFLEVMCHET